jgi:hypothetical protein
MILSRQKNNNNNQAVNPFQSSISLRDKQNLFQVILIVFLAFKSLWFLGLVFNGYCVQLEKGVHVEKIQDSSHVVWIEWIWNNHCIAVNIEKKLSNRYCSCTLL